MKNLNITLMNDGSLCDVEGYGASILELLPTVYQVDVGNKSYTLGEDSDEFFKQYGNATHVCIHLLEFKNEIGMEKVEW